VPNHASRMREAVKGEDHPPARQAGEKGIMKEETAFGSGKDYSIALLKSKELDSIPVLWKIYDDLTIRKRDRRMDGWVNGRVEEVKAKYATADWRGSPLFRGYVAMHDRFSDEKGIPSSCEGLIDFILEKGSIPRINNFVDLYNVISAITGVSIGAHDVERLEGSPRLEILPQDMLFVPIGGRGEGSARKGEFAYVDAQGVICRMDIRQCDRTKVREDTRQVFVIFQGHDSMNRALLKESMEMLDRAIGVVRV
jgi:DNA/RNA-binding domain of Phe-tRNA-synthetase-like protein